MLTHLNWLETFENKKVNLFETFDFPNFPLAEKICESHCSAHQTSVGRCRQKQDVSQMRLELQISSRTPIISEVKINHCQSGSRLQASCRQGGAVSARGVAARLH